MEDWQATLHFAVAHFWAIISWLGVVGALQFVSAALGLFCAIDAYQAASCWRRSAKVDVPTRLLGRSQEWYAEKIAEQADWGQLAATYAGRAALLQAASLAALSASLLLERLGAGRLFGSL